MFCYYNVTGFVTKMKLPYTIRPVLLEINKDSHGKCAIKICAYHRKTKKRTYRDTRYRVNPKNWDCENRYVKRGEPDASTINFKIQSQIQELEQIVSELAEQNKPINIQAVLDGDKASANIFDFAETFLAQSEGKFVKGTIVHRRLDMERIKKFSGPDLTFEQVDKVFLRKLEGHLRTYLANNSVHLVFKSLKKIFNVAIGDGITNNYPFKGNDNPKYIQPDRTWLTLSEVDRIEEVLKMPCEQSILVAGYYFLLGCYSGLRVSDWKRFNPNFISGNLLIVRAKKNGELVSIDIHPRLRKVLDELLKLPPVNTEQATNRALKSLAKLAGIEKPVTCHVSRHSFAVRCAELGISKETTADLMGISERCCSVYYKVTDNKRNVEMKKWNSIS